MATEWVGMTQRVTGPSSSFARTLTKWWQNLYEDANEEKPSIDHWSLINGPKIAKTHCSSAGRCYGWDWGLEWKFCKNDPLSFLTNQAPYLLNFNISGELPSAPASERCDLRHQRTKVELARLDATTDPAWCYTVAYTSCNINPAMMLPSCTWMSARQRQERSRQHNGRYKQVTSGGIEWHPTSVTACKVTNVPSYIMQQ